MKVIVLTILSTAVIAATAGPCVLSTNSSAYLMSGETQGLTSHEKVRVSLGPKPKGPYTATYGRIAHVPGLTMGGKTSAVIIYPSVIDEAREDVATADTFPLLSFAHATYIGGLFPATDVAYKTLMDKVVSYGFIVVAPETCSAKECFSAYAKDQIATIEACKADPSLHKALRSATFDKIGVFGHSMGAMATLASAGGSSMVKIDPTQHGIVAAVSMHPCQDLPLDAVSKIAVPTLITTGSADKICADGCAKKYYGEMPTSGRKALLSVAGASHFDPTNTGQNREDEAVALYFTCHVRGEHCDKVYGSTAKSLCQQVEGGTAAECDVVGSAPSSASATAMASATAAMEHGATASSPAAVASAPSSPSPSSAPMMKAAGGVTVDDVTIGKLTCDGIQTGHIAYPSDTSKKYPLLSFAHGWTEGGGFTKPNYKDVIESVAAAGYVVIAEHSGLVKLCYQAEKADQLRAMDFVKETPKYNAMVDWSSQHGVYGHSMGGAASGLNAADVAAVQKHNLGAAVMLHPAQGGQSAHTHIPAFFATGSADGIVPPGGVYSMYGKATGPKVFAEMANANHFECQSSEDGLPEPAGWTAYVVNWFHCHLKNSQADCEKAFAVCTDGTIKTTKCETAKA